VPAMVDFFFLADPLRDAKSWAAVAADPDAPALVDATADAAETSPWAAEALHAATLAVAEAAGRTLRKAQAPIRVALTGRTVGPPLFESMEILGRAEVVRRLRVSAVALRAGGGD